MPLPTVTSSESAEQATHARSPELLPFKEFSAVALFLGLVNLLANYLLSPFFGIYEDDYIFFLPSQSWSAGQLWDHLRWMFINEPQGRPVGWALNAVLGYLTAKHGLELAYVLGWLILTINAFLLYVVLRRASNQFAALAGAVTYLVLPVDLSKMILMHRIFVHGSMTFLLVGLALYTTGRLRWKMLGFACAAVSLTVWEAFYLPFLAAPLLEPGPVRRKLRNFAWHSGLFTVPIVVALGVRYFSGEQRVTAMAGGGLEMLYRMVQAMIIGPVTGLTTFILRPAEVILVSDAFPLLVAVVFFGLIAALMSLVPRLPEDRQGMSLGKIIFLGLAGLIALVFPYILMYRDFYFPPNMTIGRLSCTHAPAALGYATLVAFCAYACWITFCRFRRAILLLTALYFSLLVAFGIHVQAAEYVEGWNNQKFLWRRIIAQCSDAENGTTVLVDLNGLPASLAFPGFWPKDAAAGDALRTFVAFPPTWSDAPRVNAYSTLYGHHLEGNTLVLETPPWAPRLWVTIRDGNFIFLRFFDDDLRRINEHVNLFGKLFAPKIAIAKRPLRLTRIGTTILGTKTSVKWPWLGQSSPYPKR
jgi:hypothetical protein